MMSKWSNNIRNNKGYLDRCDPSTENDIDKLFHQHGRRVFKDVVPLAERFICDHIAAHALQPAADRTLLVAPGQLEHERADREAHPRPRGDRAKRRRSSSTSTATPRRRAR